MTVSGESGAPIRAGVVPLNVVAAKMPGEWIVRAMSPFTQPATLVRCVQQVVGTMDRRIEWTGYSYQGWPSYVVYGEADLPRIGWPTGVFRFDHKGYEMYGPAIRVGEVR